MSDTTEFDVCVVTNMGATASALVPNRVYCYSKNLSVAGPEKFCTLLDKQSNLYVAFPAKSFDANDHTTFSTFHDDKCTIPAFSNEQVLLGVSPDDLSLRLPKDRTAVKVASGFLSPVNVWSRAGVQEVKGVDTCASAQKSDDMDRSCMWSVDLA